MFRGLNGVQAVFLLSFAAQVCCQSLVQKVIDDSNTFSGARPNGVQYSPQWFEYPLDANRNQSTSHGSITPGSNLVYFFQGSAIYYFAERNVSHGPARIYLDNDTAGVEVFSNASTLMYQQLLWNATNLGPGDHQLVISHAGMANQSIGLDYLLVESNHGSKPELAGPGASIVPIEAVIVDDNDPRLEYSAGWEPVLPSETMHAYFNNTMHTTKTPGASVTFRFRGTAAWYFSDLQPENGKVNITLDDKASWVLSSNTGSQMQQRMIWNVTDLPNGEHKLVLTHYDNAGTRTTLDFFRYLPGTPPKPVNTVVIVQIIGAVIGGICVLIVLFMVAITIRARQLIKKKNGSAYFDGDNAAMPPLLSASQPQRQGVAIRLLGLNSSLRPTNNESVISSQSTTKGV